MEGIDRDDEPMDGPGVAYFTYETHQLGSQVSNIYLFTYKTCAAEWQMLVELEAQQQ